MNKNISKEIPVLYQREHTSSLSIAKQSAGGSKLNGGNSGFYCWQVLGGYIYFIGTPDSSTPSNPKVKLYINNNIVDTQYPTKTYVGDGYIYVVLFGNLSYGDMYYVEWDYGEGLTYSFNPRKYIGSRGTPPQVINEDAQITTTMSAPYNKSYSMSIGVLTFDSDYGELNSFSRDARDLLYTACLQTTEYDAVLGKVGNQMSYWVDQYDFNSGVWGRPNAFTTEATINKFIDGQIRVGIASSRNTMYYSTFSTYVNDWIQDVNKLIGRTLFVRDDSVGENDDGSIRITIGSHKELWGYNPDSISGDTHTYFGSWVITRWYPYVRGISHCEVKLCNELRGVVLNSSAFKDITYEELTECLGCGNDTYNTYESMFSEIWYVGKKNRLLSGGRPTVDGEVVYMLYNELENGERASEVIHKLTPSSGACIQLPSSKYSVRGKGYSVKSYAMNREVTWDSAGNYYWNSSNNCFSDIGLSVDIITSARPHNFSWTYPKISGGSFNLTYKEWNDLTERINEFRNYYDLSNYNFTTAYQNNPFTAAMYRQARAAIQAINGYGTYIPYVNSGDEITAYMMNILVSELNAIP